MFEGVDLLKSLGVGLIIFFIFFIIMYAWGKHTQDNAQHVVEFPGYFSLKTSTLGLILIGGLALIILPYLLGINKPQNNTSTSNVPDNEIFELRKQNADLINEKNALMKENEKLKDSSKNIAEATCKSLALTGYFGFHKSARYIFTSDEFTERTGIRATAVSGSWEDVHCEADKSDGTYLLKGTDNTTHEIEIKDKKSEQFIRIGTAKAKYESEVQIKSDGTLGLRRMIGEVGEMVPTYACPEYEKIYRSKMMEYDDERKKRHTEVDSKQAQNTSLRNPCITLRGQDNSEIVLAFACKDYTRTLVQQKKNTRGSSPRQNKQCNSTENSE